MTEKKWGFDTLQVHAGQEPDPVTGSRALPIYQTTAYVFRDAQHAGDLFALKEAGNIYTRLQNPTTDVLEKRIAALEGGVGALATASGMSAIMLALLNIVEAGQEIVASSALYGGTFNLFAVTFKKMGIKVHFIDPKDLAGFEGAMNEKTRAVYVENISNPSMAVVDSGKGSGNRTPARRAFGGGCYLHDPLSEPAHRVWSGYRDPFRHEIFRGPRQFHGRTDCGFRPL